MLKIVTANFRFGCKKILGTMVGKRARGEGFIGNAANASIALSFSLTDPESGP